MKKNPQDKNKKNSRLLRLFNPQPLSQGIATLELLVAFALAVTFLVGATLVSFGGQSASLDVKLTGHGLSTTTTHQEAMALGAFTNWAGTVSVQATTTQAGGNIYDAGTTITDISECMKFIATGTGWKSDMNRGHYLGLATLVASTSAAIKLGGDCNPFPPESTWDNPQRYARDSLNPGRPTTIDVLNKIAYLGVDVKPHLFIADTRSAVYNPSADQSLFITFSNSFNSSGKVIDEINDIDVYKDVVSGKTYAFIAMASTTAQLVVMDVTDMHNPFIAKNSLHVLAKRNLAGITATDLTSWGWRLQYYGDKLYNTSRETAGPELHIFDVTDPTNPTEIGSEEINTTANDFTVRDGLAYFAVDSDARGELLVYNVSVPASITEIVGARGQYSGNQNGASVYLLGNKLYFGRYNVPSSPEFYILGVATTTTAVGGLPVLGFQEISTDVIGIRVTSKFAFLVTLDASKGLQVWNILDPSNMQSINLTFNFGNKPAYIDYGPDFIYATGESTPNFQILYSP